MLKPENQILSYTTKPNKAEKKLTKTEYESMVSQWGKEYVDNDFYVDALVFYPMQNIKNQLGTITLTAEDIYKIEKAANAELDARLGHSWRKLKSWAVGKTVDNYDNVHVTEDHSMDISKRNGFTNGKFRIELLDGEPVLFARFHIIKPEVKINIKMGLYREISGTIRMDDTIAEISFVGNPALRYAAILAEPSGSGGAMTNLDKQQQLIAKLSELNTKVSALESAKTKLVKEEKISKNLSRLIRTGKIHRRDRDFFKAQLMEMDDSAVNSSTTMMMLSEPVIEFNKNEVKNFNYMEGIMANQELDNLMKKFEAGEVTLKQVQAATVNQPKGQFAEGEKPNEDKGKFAEDKKAMLAKFSSFAEKEDWAGLAEALKMEASENEPEDDDKKEKIKAKAKMSELTTHAAQVDSQLSELKGEVTKIVGMLTAMATPAQGAK